MDCSNVEDYSDKTKRSVQRNNIENDNYKRTFKIKCSFKRKY